MWLPLHQFVAISLSDSRIPIRFAIVLEKLKKVLSYLWTAAKLWAEVANVKYEKSSKTTSNSLGPTIYRSGTPDSKLLLILFSLRQCFLVFKYE